LGSLGVFHGTPMHLYYDSQVALHIAKNLIFREQTNDIEIDYDFIGEKLEIEDLAVSYLACKE